MVIDSIFPPRRKYKMFFYFFIIKLKIARLLLVASMLIALSNGYKILFLAPFYGKSHWMYMSSFVRNLLDRQHEVTFLTSHTLNHSNMENYTEVLIDPPFPAKEASELKLSPNRTTTKTYFN